MTKIAILGTNGRLGRVVAKAFIDAGYDVRVITRSGKITAELIGSAAVTGDGLDREALIRATEGVDIIFNGLNPIYTDWGKCLPMAENVMAACRANHALHLAPGSVYNYGSPMPTVITEDTPFHPTTEKGRIRVAMEDLFRREAEAGRVRTILLRAGDFFGGTGTGSWFDLMVAAKMDKGVYTAPGPADLLHEWAYLPDMAKAFVGLTENLDKLGTYEALNFPGHAVTDLEIKAAAEQALGRTLKLTSMPWWVLRAGSPFVAMWRELVSMSYLRFEPHQLVSARLESILGTIPHTPLDRAVAEALDDIGVATIDGVSKAA
ncbi:NAD-dependent epimerase/dehydratase family protein [Mesorhizobium sp.]|uniref:NAD-dependent epimerase/dehydratase family protein n=1 Tax=Mesorhizobium sp. TaxID=1871066 RepID=UPI000FE96C5F|nr:NAD-dependent epimerase/dehydratase family protein [Mesorhizobium sp.]RWO53401.1 MAG: NAD-dependent epimerase/dehydratase family protein [Mesorhizobium sp.]TIN24644.1 MAG: NAD-dependent epimerase/dehydratase family protein [Mesorhizobium sp.]TIN42464.1 MAG: NAD-dependent epimerase/dehydratase family protein [Mesorhizobium sp.]TJU79403.1 MAG: NAD-dependent epimerase/dehydratase family protein [Mesorhizobium sp.]TJU91235.1 MAG: NAD-dependent epimerase/dehydratase family protein [Mesorhizobium